LKPKYAKAAAIMNFVTLPIDMKKSYYLFNPGRLSRKDDSLKFVSNPEEGQEVITKYIPIASVGNLYCFGALDANSALYNFLGKQQIAVHFFDYYEHYTGSFMPKEYLLSGKVLLQQTLHYTHLEKRLCIAQKFVSSAAYNILKNLKYYHARGRDFELQIRQIENYASTINSSQAIDQLMGIEGNIRSTYYSAFDAIITDFEMGNRSKQPPSNEVNALISFLNMMCYTLCLDMIYHTQLNPTISYLHEPGFRRYSLALDLAEVFKPILVDKCIFMLLNKKILQKSDFDLQMNSCLIKASGKKKIVKAWDDKLSETIQHKTLGRKVSYKHLVKLECYKLVKHIMEIDEYQPFKAWW
jgi:CRISP-associated protein Cas1